ncbi:MAG: NAD-dependent epimerase/dehydratase family protein [Pseudomonadota bacterium]
MITNLDQRRTWLVTGSAGFIGSHLVERLLNLGQRVIGVDNFATGSRQNVDAVRASVSPEKGALYSFFEQDIRDRDGLVELCAQHAPHVILHQAALGSVPRSIVDPVSSHQANVDGFVNILEAARAAGVKRFVYASSSSVYGDIGAGAKVEGEIGNCLSPYAATKRIDEIYAQVYARTYGLETIGLRYFNVFGPRQDPNGPYAAVIPRWLAAMRKKEGVVIYGDGSTSRDFCFIANVVQANLLAASVAGDSPAIKGVVNIACGATTTLLKLEELLRHEVSRVLGCQVADIPGPRHEPFRQGDIPHSLADISFAKRALGYDPTYSVAEGVAELVRIELGR